MERKFRPQRVKEMKTGITTPPPSGESDLGQIIKPHSSSVSLSFSKK